MWEEVENVELRVEFHPCALPSTVRWTVWADLDGPTFEQVKPLNHDHAVHRLLTLAERVVMGFRWEWE